MVGWTRIDRRGIAGVCRLHDLGSPDRHELQMGSVPVAPVFAGTQFLLVAILTGDSDPLGSRRFPLYLLLLPQGILPGVRSDPTRMRRGRPPAKVQRRALSAVVPESAPLLHVHRRD